MDIQKKLNIKKGDLVLEVGSGSEPYWRSDVLLDKQRVDKTGDRNYYELKEDSRKLIIADALKMPFKDYEFDYVICNHVVEHISDITTLFIELQRVAPRGFIGCPSSLYEKLYEIDRHIWMIDYLDNKLYFRRKCEETFTPCYFNNLFKTLYRVNLKNNSIRLMFKQFRPLFFIEYEWENIVDYEILDVNKTVIDYSDYEYIKLNTDYGINKVANRNSLYRQMIRKLQALTSTKAMIRGIVKQK